MLEGLKFSVPTCGWLSSVIVAAVVTMAQVGRVALDRRREAGGSNCSPEAQLPAAAAGQPAAAVSHGHNQQIQVPGRAVGHE